MRPRIVVRTFAIGLALLASLGLVACSSDDDNGSSGQSGGDTGSTEEYCEAVRELVEIAEQAGGAQVSEDVVDQLTDLLTQANQSAPPQIRRDFSAAFLGSSDAQESVERYNQETCGLDNGVGGTATSAP
jgi:hypothetical protein